VAEYQDGAWRLHRLEEFGFDPGANGKATERGTNESAEVVLCPVRQDLAIIMLPEQLIQFTSENRLRHRTSILRSASQTSLGRFLSMVPARDGGLWIGGVRGVAKVQGPVRALTPDNEWHDYLPPEALGASHFREVQEDDQGNLTALAQSSSSRDQTLLMSFDGQTWAINKRLNEKVLHAWHSAGRRFQAMLQNSLLEWADSGSEIVENTEISARQYHDVAIEPGGIFWLATSDGLFRYSPLIWEAPTFARDLHRIVSCVSGDQAGRLWFISSNALHVVQEDQAFEYPFPAAFSWALQSASGIYPLKSGAVAIESGRQLFQFDPQNGAFRQLQSAGIAEIKALGFFREGVIAVEIAASESSTNVTSARLEVFDGDKFAPLSLPGAEQALSPGLSRFFVAQNRDVWVGGQFGVACLHNKEWRMFSSKESSAPNTALAFIELPDSKIWCATPDRIWEFDGKNWATVRRGFDKINALMQTRDGSVWVASNGGLHRFFQQAWADHGTEEGLPGTSVRGLWEDQNDRLWAATSLGLSRYHPKADPDAPRTMIEPLGAGETNIPENATLTISFSGRDKWDLTPRSRLLFSHRLDGREWSDYQDIHSVSFSDLAAGKHFFQVRSMDRNFNVDPKPARLEFSVVLPWYRERRLVLIASTGMAVAMFFAVLAFNRHRHLVRSYAEVEQKVEQRTKELEIASRELLHSQKMNALGTLSAGIAHDFNNILSIVKGSAQIIEENLGNPEKVRTRVERIKTVVEQGAGIVKAMLGFSRESDQQPEPCDLNAAVEDTIKLLGDRFLREAQVTFKPAHDLPAVSCSKGFIQQILLNFIFNAAESMTRSRLITIATGRSGELPHDLVLVPARAVSYVWVSVKDAGSGILPGNISRIFEPFFTTKAMSDRRGTGLGLSMVYELAKKMEAGLAVHSVVGEGSTFTLILPVVAQVPNGVTSPSTSTVENKSTLEPNPK
jgi:signal transduction histidine kinase